MKKYTFYHHESKRVGADMLLEYYILPSAMVNTFIWFQWIPITFCAKKAMRVFEVKIVN